MDPECTPQSPASCALNLAGVQRLSGDLGGAFRTALPGAEGGDQASIAFLVELCEQAGDETRAATWREALASTARDGQ